MQHDADRAITSPSEDQYGFVEFAKKLAPSIASAADGAGMVIGVEGKWGSGKTSLMNFLKQELSTFEKTDLHILNVSPWLQGDGTELVTSLLAQMTPILEAEEVLRMRKQKNEKWTWRKKQVKKAGEVLRGYAAKTSRGIAPLLKLGGFVVPGMSVASDAATAGGDMLDSWGTKSSVSELKDEIVTLLEQGNARFVVLLDDLDRLEPSQAVEVVRLVRSVADFPRVAYLLCYDREVLSRALEKGLQVSDGEAYLQKIVQLSFPMPLLEPFDLRLALKEQILEFLTISRGEAPAAAETEEIELSVNTEGHYLTVPRDVKLAMNAIKFAYTSVGEEAHLPDICRIQLIRTTRPKLYRWLENYLNVRSVLVSGGASLNEADRVRMGKKLKKLMPDEKPDSPRSIWHLAPNFPGIRQADKPEECIFQQVGGRDVRRSIENRRISSPIHSRLYFAFAIPKTVMPDDEFSALQDLAASDSKTLSTKLIEYSNKRRPIGGTWLVHIMDRLDSRHIESMSDTQIFGWAFALSNCMDEVLRVDNQLGAFIVTTAQTGASLVRKLIDELRGRSAQLGADLVDRILQDGTSLNWLVGNFFRDELWDHGVVGDRPKSEHERCLTSGELRSGKKILSQRISSKKFRERISLLPDLSGFMWGWRDLAGSQAPRAWVKSHVNDDTNFLNFLLALRGWRMSDEVSFPLHKSSIKAFLNLNQTIKRVEDIQANAQSEEMKVLADEVSHAISIGADRD